MRQKGYASNAGSALVATLFVMVLLIALAAAAATQVRLHVRSARASVSELQRMQLAMAAVRYAEVVLRRDETATDSLDEEWALLGDGGRLAYSLEPGQFRVQIIDAASRININTATEEMLLHLPGVEQSLADAILDWREEGDTPRPSGAKADYYQALPTPYLPRGGPFETVGELLLVRDVTPELLYGPPQTTGLGEEPTTDKPLSEWITVLSRERNVSAQGQPRVNLNTASAEALMNAAGGALTPQQAQAIVTYRQQSGEFTSVAGLLDVPGLGVDQARALMDVTTTVTGATIDGRVNVNTAPAEVLAALPGMTPEAAEAIVVAREANGTGWESIGDLLEGGLVETQVFRQAAPHLCTRSSIFLVRAMGSVPESPAVTAVEAVVERTEETTRLLRWARVERAPGWIAWGWPRQAVSEESTNQ
ncbi:MAG: type II secretion system protein GspK [Armatimonadota bacterium]|nr:type II secretion system protein GspK [Armatimonadota bacterium]